MRFLQRGIPALAALVLVACQVRTVAGEPASLDRLHVAVINGGASKGQNYQSHFLHVRRLLALLARQGIAAKRITVFDADRSPVALPPNPIDGGRGLYMVDALALAWGVECRPNGKTVCAELPFPKPRESMGTSSNTGCAAHGIVAWHPEDGQAYNEPSRCPTCDAPLTRRRFHD